MGGMVSSILLPRQVGNLQLCRGTRVFVEANRCSRFAEGNFPRKGNPLSNDRRERKSKYQEAISCQKSQRSAGVSGQDLRQYWQRKLLQPRRRQARATQ